MRRFTRFRQAVARAVARLTGRAPDRDRGDRDFTGGGGGGSPIERDPDESRLPPGWTLVGLYHQGQATTRINATGDTEVTDRDISEADALIVWYSDAGDDGYRWIHGAADWDGLSDVIDHTLIVVSPVSSSE